MIFHRHLWLLSQWGNRKLPTRYCRICQRFEIWTQADGWRQSDLHVLAPERMQEALG